MKDRMSYGWCVVRTLLPSLASAAMLGLPGPAASIQLGDAPEVTYAAHVAEILQQNCQVCHQPNAIGPMSLMSYEQVRPWAPMIRDQVVGVPCHRTTTIPT